MKEKYMELAIEQAEKAYKLGEVPIGCIIVKDDKIIAKAHNMVEKKKDSTMHAEIIAIKKASKRLKNWRLIDCNMYVTLEPCLMCKSAIELSRIKNVYYSTASDNDINIKKTKYKEYKKYSKNTLELLQKFFKNKR